MRLSRRYGLRLLTRFSCRDYNRSAVYALPGDAMIGFLKSWALLIAIVLGFVLHETAGRCIGLTPYLLFTMLLLTFCNISPKDLRFERLHLVLLAAQLGAAFLLYAALVRLNPLYARAAGVSVFMPTATAAAVITGMLGGSIAFAAAYTFLASFAVAVLTPVFLPFVGTAHAGEPFLTAALSVAGRVAPVLLLPLLVAWALQLWTPRIHAFLLRRSGAAFWIWAALLVILMGRTFNFLLGAQSETRLELGVSLIAVAVCALQFIAGKAIGARYGRRISAGQSLAQKNTALGMWLGFQYMDPVIAVGCAAYAVFQNIVNSCQLWLRQRAGRPKGGRGMDRAGLGEDVS